MEKLSLEKENQFNFIKKNTFGYFFSVETNPKVLSWTQLCSYLPRFVFFVWSAEGPVLWDLVPPLFNCQSCWSFTISFFQWHKSLSKVQLRSTRRTPKLLFNTISLRYAICLFKTKTILDLELCLGYGGRNISDCCHSQERWCSFGLYII